MFRLPPLSAADAGTKLGAFRLTLCTFGAAIFIPPVSAYVTSKHAVIGMMRTAALEGAPFNIRVNTVNPAPIETRMMRSLEEGFAPGAAAQAKTNLSNWVPS